ncbi:MAG: hypothetical protein DHS20C20_17680 [Ardenticatenaceae bacterium]|nr:MAG: hypothetical protein DHS20C20_17680 [Ardenticatenaceae bacterium]
MMLSEFDHIYWLGGSPCAGKSSIAQKLCEQFGLHLYHCDSQFEQHLKQVTPKTAPTIHHLHQLSCDELWLRPVAEQLRTEITYHEEQFQMILADLQKLPTETKILVEGAVLMPTAVSPYLHQNHQAIWIIPTASFQRHHYAQRPWVQGVLKDCGQPDLAFENWMQRDIAYAKWIRQETAVHELNCLVVDGSYTIEENCQRAAQLLQLGS